MKPSQAHRGKLRPCKIQNVKLFLALTTILFIIDVSKGYTQGKQAPGSISVGQPVANTALSIQIPSGGLQIGDQIPDEIWNLPLQVVNYPDDKESVTLSDFRGKLIILDFWATWCGPCVASIPKMHRLKDVSDEIALIPVTDEGRQRVRTFLEMAISPEIKELAPVFYTIAEDRTLRRLFPFKSLPHVVIISKTGVVKAITSPEYVMNKAIVDLLNGNDPQLPVKREDAGLPLLSLAYPDIKTDSQVYYTALTGYLKGFTYPSGFEVNSAAGFAKHYYINYPVLKLYTFALRGFGGPIGLAYLPSRRILAVRNPSDFVFMTSRNPSYCEEESNLCYEAILPPDFTENRARRKMKADLDAYLNLNGRLEKRTIDCLILKQVDERTPEFIARGGERKRVISGMLQTKVPEKAGSSVTAANTYIRNWSLSKFVYWLNHLEGQPLPPVFDETKYTGPVDLDLPNDLSDLVALRKMLRSQGLDLVFEEREIEMFVLTEAGCDLPQNAELKLTKYGYLPVDYQTDHNN